MEEGVHMKQIFTIMEQTSRHSIKAISIFYIIVAMGMMALGFTQQVYSYTYLMLVVVSVVALWIIQIRRISKQFKTETYQRILLLPEKKAYMWSELIFHMITFIGLFLVFYFSWLLYLMISGMHSVNQIVLTSWDNVIFKSMFPYERLNLIGNLMLWMNIGIQCYVFTISFKLKKFIWVIPVIILDFCQIQFSWQYSDYSVIFHMMFYIAAWGYSYITLKQIFRQKKEVKS